MASPTFAPLPAGWYSVYDHGDKLFLQPCPGVITYSKSETKGMEIFLSTNVSFAWLGKNGSWQDVSDHPAYKATIFLGTGTLNITRSQVDELLMHNSGVVV